MAGRPPVPARVLQANVRNNRMVKKKLKIESQLNLHSKRVS